LCKNELLTLSGSGAVSYTWNAATGIAISNNQAFKATVAGMNIYTLTGMDAKGCKASDTVSVTAHPLPIIDAVSNQALCMGEFITLNATSSTGQHCEQYPIYCQPNG